MTRSARALFAALLTANVWGTVMAADDVRVDARLKDRNTRLEVAWSVHNPGDRPWLALVRPLRHDLQPARHGLYVLAGDDGVVEFALRAFAAPPGGGSAALERIAAVALAPGASLEGVVSLELPLALRSPYRDNRPLPAGVTHARVCIGLLDPVAEPAAAPGSRLPDGALALYHEAAVAARQRVVCSAPQALAGR